MLIQNTEVFGFQSAIRSMRNPMNSWDKSDSYFSESHMSTYECMDIGPDDIKLMQNLIKAGPEHRKALRFIKIWATLTLPRYVWTEFDTYKVGCERMSCSTMHKLGKTTLTQSDFQLPIASQVLDSLNQMGEQFRCMLAGSADANQLLRLMKNSLPEGFLQKADISMNYETALNMFRQRKDHRLPEWKWTGENNYNSICNWIHSLPLMALFIKGGGHVS
jgi:hypothetical protein